MPDTLTGQADRARAEAAVAEAYATAGLAGPTEMHWYDSPREAAAAYLRRTREQRAWPPGHGRHLLWTAAETVEVEAGSDTERTAVRRQLLADLLTAEACAEQEFLGWAAISTPYERADPRHPLRAVTGPIAEACAHAGWWWPDRDAVILAERPTHAGFDGQDRPHDPGRPAAEFPDGWAVHAWHGLRVPAWVINTPHAAAIARETNAEVRRAAIESMGWDAFITAAGLTALDSCPDPGNPGCELTLYAAWRAERSSRLLVCTNGTPERDGTRRAFGLHVPTDLKDALSAAAWCYGLTNDQYAPIRRT